jgi:hypothetical protein
LTIGCSSAALSSFLGSTFTYSRFSKCLGERRYASFLSLTPSSYECITAKMWFILLLYFKRKSSIKVFSSRLINDD